MGWNKKIVILFFAAFALRALFGLFVMDFTIAADGAGYDAIARNIVSGGGFALEAGAPTPTRAPLYPFFLSIIYFVFGHSFGAVMLLQAAIDSGTCVLAYKIAERVFKNEKTAALAAAVYAVHPVMIALSDTLLAETLFTFIFALSVYFLLKGAEKGSFTFYALSGAALGLSTLARGTAMAFPVIALLFIMISRKKISGWFILVLAMALIMVPWTARNYEKFHKFIPVGTVGPGLGLYTTGLQLSGQGSYEESIQKGRQIAAGNPADYIESEAYLKAEGLKMISRSPAGYAELMLKRLPGFWLSSHSSAFGFHDSLRKYVSDKNYAVAGLKVSLLAVQAVLLLAAALGFYYSGSGAAGWLPLLILVYFTGHVAFDPVPRYTLPAMPYLFMLSAAGFVGIAGILKDKKWKA